MKNLLKSIIFFRFFFCLIALAATQLFSAGEHGETISFLDVSPPFPMSQRPFYPIAMKCDDVELDLSNLQDRIIRGRKDSVDFCVRYTLDSLPCSPHITGVFENTNHIVGQNNIFDQELQSNFYILSRTPADNNNPAFNNITTWLQNFQQPQLTYEGCPCFSIIGILRDGRKIEVDFAQKNNDSYNYFPLQRHEIYYRKEQNRLKIFCKMSLSDHIFGFHDVMIKSWDLNNHSDYEKIVGQLFYDGENIYDKISLPSWFNSWCHVQLTSSGKESLKILTLFKEEPRNCVAINPNSVINQTPIPVGCYITQSTVSRQRIAAIYSDGNSAACFLVECLRENWQSVTLPRSSYNVDTFYNTQISVPFSDRVLCDGRYNQNDVWEEGLYISNSQPSSSSQVWERKYSQHGRQNYTLNSDVGNFFSYFQKPQSITDDSVYVEHISYFPLLNKVNLPYVQDVLIPNLPRMDALVSLSIIRMQEPEFEMLNLIRCIAHLPQLEKLTIKVLFKYIEYIPTIERIADILAQRPNLRILKLPIPSVRSHVQAAGQNIKSTLLSAAVTTTAGVGAVALSGSFLTSSFFDFCGWIAKKSYDEHLAFARKLAHSRSLQALTLYNVYERYDQKNIQSAFNEGRSATRQATFNIEWN